MTLEDRIAAFEKLGKYLSAIDPNELSLLIEKTGNENSWFTPESIKTSFAGLSQYLDRNKLETWTSKYPTRSKGVITIAVVMAGNVPLVGFHDFLSVLISGHRLLAKLSTKDSTLIRFVADTLIRIEQRFAERIKFEEQQLKNFDAVIATGSDNSARYFHYYFGKYPNITRKNRTSVAVLTGDETDQQLTALAVDVFTYFGLGCRNVSKLFVPNGYDFGKLFLSWEESRKVLMHHKYNNNYDYQKSILLLNRIDFMDNGFVMLERSTKLVSPISVLYYESYSDEGDLALKLTEVKDKLQCIVGNTRPANVAFGRAQFPELWDYADQVDTMKFLSELS
jgi:hypothetical protein